MDAREHLRETNSFYEFISACAGRSVMKLCAGACAMKNGSLAFSAALCGVTPQAQNTGTMPGGTGGTGPPNSGSLRSAPITAGSPRWIGAPWLNGNLDVT